MGSLTDLLSRANARVAEQKELDDLAKKAKTPSEAAEINAKVKAWRDASEWSSVGSVVRILTWHCACGVEQITGPGQELVKQRQNVFKGETRLVAPSETLALPKDGTREIIFERLEYKVCASCAGSKGYW